MNLSHDKIRSELLRSRSAIPKIHDCKHSLHRNVSLRIATGNPHPNILRIPDFERSAPKRRALAKNINSLVGRGGLGHASATPKIHDCKHSLHRNVSLRIATGNPHPHVLYIYYINLVGKGGLEPPHPCGYQILSLTRLPFRHSPNKLIKYIKLLILLTL